VTAAPAKSPAVAAKSSAKKRTVKTSTTPRRP
jgi:hypothetical protein